MSELAPSSEVIAQGLSVGQNAGPGRLNVEGAPTGTLSSQAIEQLLTASLLTTQFAYVYDYFSKILVFVSAGVTQLLGEQPALSDMSPAWFTSRLHPDDAPGVVEAQLVVDAYLRARAQTPLPGFLFSLDYRLRHADGCYRRVLHECLLFEREPGTGTIRRILVLFTDISHHKLTTDVHFHVNQPDFTAFAANWLPGAPTLTSREQQVLTLVLRGLTSRQIAYHLRLRESTVKTHRRNLLRKSATHNLHGLLSHLTQANRVGVVHTAVSTSRCRKS